MGVYDKTLREILNNVPVNLIKILSKKKVKKLLNSSFPSVKEREADFLVELEDGEIFHLEIQSVNDSNMPRRMLFYALLIEESYKKFPIQAVLYVGDEKNNIKAFLKRKNLSYKYEVFDIRSIDCKILIESESIEDNILSILCKIENETSLLEKITSKLLTLPEKKRADYLRKLLTISRLRPKIFTKLENYLKEIKMPIVIDIKKDPIYKKGWNEAWNEAWSEAWSEAKKKRIEDAIKMIKEFNLPIEIVAKKLEIEINELKKAIK